MNPVILTIYTTLSNQAEAEKLVRILLEKKLIACGVSWEANSQYHWQGKAVNDQEYVVFMKSSVQLEKSLTEELNKIHPYDTPALLITETRVNQAYFEWVQGEVMNSEE